MPEGALSKSAAAPPRSLDRSIPEKGRVMEAGHKPIQIMEASRVMEAEGYVPQTYMGEGYEHEAMRKNAEHSWNRPLGQTMSRYKVDSASFT